MHRRKQTSILFRCHLLVVSCVLAAFPPFTNCSAQTAGTGSIQGTVTDATSAAIAGSPVTITNSATQVSHASKTSGRGLFTFPNLPIGSYTIDVSMDGFRTYRQTGIVLEVGSSIEVNVTMAVGEASQRVEVRADSLALQSEDASFKQTIDQNTITEMPLNGRQVTSLITLSGGAAVAPTNDIQGSKTFYSSVVISIAGGQGIETDYRLDGGDHNDYMSNINLPFPFPDALNEFSVESGTMGAQSGLHPGGLVNVVTRSGSNQWHGSAFEFIRNNYIDATNFFATSKDTLHQNQFGGTFGGRIIRDKIFFFGGYQRLNANAGSSKTQAYIPTPANMNGDFSVTDGPGCTSTGKFVQLLNPQTGAVLVNDQISTNYFNSSALALQSYLPATSDPCGLVHYVIPSVQGENEIIGRVDSTLTKRHSLYGRYFLDGYQSPAWYSPTNLLLTTQTGNYQRVQSLVLGEAYLITPNIVNSFHATGTRRRIDRGPNAQGINATTVGVNIYAPVSNFLEVAATNKFTTYCGTCAFAEINGNTFSYTDDVNIARGKHQLAFGGEFVKYQLNVEGINEANGDFNFSGVYSQHGPTGSGGVGTGADADLDFLSGSMSSFSQSSDLDYADRGPIPSLYIQDTYHATKRLVISGGLRWEPEFMPSDYFGRGSTFNMSGFLNNQHSIVYPNAPAGEFYYGDAGIPKNFTKNSPWQFSPRFGITFDLSGAGKTLFRAGGALTYDEVSFYVAHGTSGNPPFANVTTNTPVAVPLSFTNPWSNGTVIGNPFPQPFKPTAAAVFSNGGKYLSTSTNFHPAYEVQWTASVQHEFSHNWQLQIDYIGNTTKFNPYGLPLDLAVYIPGTCGGTACSTVGNEASRFALTIANPSQGPKYLGGGGGLLLQATGANSTYNGMIVTFQHRMSTSLSVLTNYTWSHCIDIEDAQGDVATTTVQNAADIKMDRSNCGFDHRLIFNTTFVGVSHFPLSGWKDLVVNNWELGPLLHIQDGAPFTVTSGVDNSLTDTGNDRPNLVNPSEIYTHTKITSTNAGNRLYILASAFAPNAIGAFGDVGRNSLRGPGLFQLDSALSRFFPLNHEGLKLDVRLEAFNVLNHPSLGNPGASLNSSTFGQVTATSGYGARVFQGGLKIIF